MLRLLEPANSLTGHGAPFIEIFGKKWVASEYTQISDAPEYTCISYAWGDDTTINPFDHQNLMSTRTIPAIEATISGSQSQKNWAEHISFSHNSDPLKEKAGQDAAFKASQALWIDALCVPFHDPARTKCLQSMGEIYSSSFQVFVVLSNACSDIFDHFRNTGEIELSHLPIIENENWTSRAWTYQETVNSKTLYFTSEGRETFLISGQNFLNKLIKSIDSYKAEYDIDNITWVENHQKLYKLQQLLADYMISDYVKRSAFQVMSAMDQRISQRSEDYYYAMIGAIANKSLNIDDDEPVHPASLFMRVCERKSDFSFIYSTSSRSKIAGRRWQPINDRLPAVLPNLVTFGSGQTGLHNSTHLQLDNMSLPIPGTITSDGLQAARWFMETNSDGLSSDGIASGIIRRLKILGFTGCGEYLEFETGFFFPQSMPLNSDEIFVVVSGDIHWVTGGPGLLLRSDDTGINEFRKRTACLTCR